MTVVQPAPDINQLEGMMIQEEGCVDNSSWGAEGTWPWGWECSRAHHEALLRNSLGGDAGGGEGQGGYSRWQPPGQSWLQNSRGVQDRRMG